MPATKRQLRLDEDIQGFSDDQLCTLVWMGILVGSPDLKPRLRLFRDEIERRKLLSPADVTKLGVRIERI